MFETQECLGDGIFAQAKHVLTCLRGRADNVRVRPEVT